MNKRVTVFREFIYLLGIYLASQIGSAFIWQVVFKQADYTVFSNIIVGISLLIFIAKFYQVELFGKHDSKLGAACVAIGLIITLFLNNDLNHLARNIPKLESIMLSSLGTAIFEESIFRVVMIFLISSIFIHSAKKLYFEIYLSSVIFGLAHFLNMLSIQQDFAQTVIQTLYAFCLGTIFAISYLATKNILYAILIHFLADTIAILLSSSVITNIPITLLNMITLVLAFVVMGMFNWFVLHNMDLVAE